MIKTCRWGLFIFVLMLTSACSGLHPEAETDQYGANEDREKYAYQMKNWDHDGILDTKRRNDDLGPYANHVGRDPDYMGSYLNPNLNPADQRYNRYNGYPNDEARQLANIAKQKDGVRNASATIDGRQLSIVLSVSEKKSQAQIKEIEKGVRDAIRRVIGDRYDIRIATTHEP